MKKILSCGQYICCVIGDDKLIDLIPVYWIRDYSSELSFSEVVNVYLKTAYGEHKGEFKEGWNILENGSSSQALYVHNRKAVFSLQYTIGKEVVVSLRKALEGYARIGIHYGLMLALHQKCIGLHGVTLLCGNEIIILSASSGTGKTTLAKLLGKYCDAIVINGDFALLTPTIDSVIFEPTPFCGTSGRALKHRFRVNRIVFLGQSKENRWHTLNGREAMKRFMSNAFIPAWDSEKQLVVQRNILKCIDSIKVNAYDFAPTKEAAEFFLKQVEGDSSLRSE